MSLRKRKLPSYDSYKSRGWGSCHKASQSEHVTVYDSLPQTNQKAHLKKGKVPLMVIFRANQTRFGQPSVTLDTGRVYVVTVFWAKSPEQTAFKITIECFPQHCSTLTIHICFL